MGGMSFVVVKDRVFYLLMIPAVRALAGFLRHLVFPMLANGKIVYKYFLFFISMLAFSMLD